MDNYHEITKPLAVRMVELVRALQLINDSIKELRKGRIQHLASLSGQLRALLTERTRKADPLLLEIARMHGRALAMYCMPDLNDPTFPESLRGTSLMRLSGFPMTAHRQYAAQQRLEFTDILNHKIVEYKQVKYTVGDVINWYANWSGGAHYSRNLPSDFAELLALSPPGLEPLANALVQIAEATLIAGRDLLKSIVDVEIHALILVPQQEVGDANYLFDSQYPDTPMRLSIFLNKRLMLSFLACGIQGSWARVDADRLVDWTKLRHVQASLRIDDDLTTVLELAVDGNRIGRVRIDEPLFVVSHQRNYELFHNKAANEAPQQFTFGLGEILIIGSEMPLLDRAKLLLYLDSRRQDSSIQLAVYEPNSFAYAAPGTTDLKMTGNVRLCTLSEMLTDCGAAIDATAVVDTPDT